MFQFIESLESRQFLSASPAHVKALPTQTQINDQSAIAAAKLTLNNDIGSFRNLLAADKAAIITAKNTDTTQLHVDQGKLVADRGDALAQSADRNLITADKKQLVLDQANTKGTLVSDTGTQNATLKADKKAISQAEAQYRFDVSHHV